MQLLARARTPWIGAGALLLAAVLLRPYEPTRTAIRVDSALAEALALDVWTEARIPGEPIDIVVTERELMRLERSGIAYEVLDRDIDATAAAEALRLQTARPGDDWFAEYHDLDDIGEHLDALARSAPDRASLHIIGGSIEQRPIWALKIGKGTPMLINGTQHAREWIATAVSTCIADRLVRDYNRDPRVKAFVDTTELWVVPVVNPDGYQHTWKSDRYWRKNRRDKHGVDLNRNFSVAFGGKGSSASKRSEIYRGEHAFSEPETQALRDLVQRVRPELHVDFHAYGQLLLYPWMHTKTAAPDRDRYRAIADRMASAIYSQHEKRYVMKSGEELYASSGTMSDYMYGEAKALSYTIELRPQSGGYKGFVLPPEQIRPTCDEAFAAVMALRSAR